MSDIATATVEVLTAEVRVLMVGSRQVTLSVARQLDDVDPDGFVPFGRVATGRKPDAGSLKLSGRLTVPYAGLSSRLRLSTATECHM